MVRRSAALIIVAVVLSACAMPFGHSTLAQQDLNALLVKPGDLPATTQPGQVRSGPPPAFNLPTPDRAASEILSNGMLVVAVYGAQSPRQDAYGRITNAIKQSAAQDTLPAMSDLGEQSAVYAPVSPGDAALVTFIRCQAVAFIELPDTPALTSITAYAKRLDSRLKTAVC